MKCGAAVGTWRYGKEVEGGAGACSRRCSPNDRRSGAAFTLLEVMIALAIFFMAAFTVLESVSQSLRTARALQQNWPDPRSLVAELSLTNKLEEGSLEGDFGDVYPDFVWTREIYLERTNGLFRVEFTIHGVVGKRVVESRTSTLLWRPESTLRRAP